MINMMSIRNGKKAYLIYLIGFFTLVTIGLVVKSFNDKIALMTGSVQSYQMMVDKQSDQMKAINQEKERLKRDLSSNGESLREVRSSLSKLEEDCSKTQHSLDLEVEEWKGKYQELKESTAKLESKYKTLSKSNADSISEIEFLNNENRQLRDKVQDMESMKASELMRLRDSLGLAAIDRDKYKDQYSALFKQYQQSLDTVQILQDEKDRLMEQIREIQRLSGGNAGFSDSKPKQVISPAASSSSTPRGIAVMEEPGSKLGDKNVGSVMSSSSTLAAPVAAEPIAASLKISKQVRTPSSNVGGGKLAPGAPFLAPAANLAPSSPAPSKDPVPIGPSPVHVEIRGHGGSGGKGQGFGPSSTAAPKMNKQIVRSDQLSPVVKKDPSVNFGNLVGSQRLPQQQQFLQKQEPINTRYGQQAPRDETKFLKLPSYQQYQPQDQRRAGPAVAAGQRSNVYPAPLQGQNMPQLVQKHQYAHPVQNRDYRGAQHPVQNRDYRGAQHPVQNRDYPQHPHQQLLLDKQHFDGQQNQQLRYDQGQLEDSLNLGWHDQQLNHNGQVEAADDNDVEIDEFNDGEGDETGYENDLDALQAPDLMQPHAAADLQQQYFYPGQHLGNDWGQLMDSPALLQRGGAGNKMAAISGNKMAPIQYGNNNNGWKAPSNNVQFIPEMKHYMRDF